MTAARRALDTYPVHADPKMELLPFPRDKAEWFNGRAVAAFALSLQVQYELSTEHLADDEIPRNLAFAVSSVNEIIESDLMMENAQWDDEPSENGTVMRFPMINLRRIALAVYGNTPKTGDYIPASWFEENPNPLPTINDEVA